MATYLKTAGSLTLYSLSQNNIIIGTRQGHLLFYSIQSNPDGQKVDIALLQYNKSFSKKPIVQLEVIVGLKILFSLSDSVLMINDINRHNSPLIHLAAKTKGTSVFAIDSRAPKSLTGDVTVLVRLCAAIKRKLQLWYWKYDQLVELNQEIELSDYPKALAFSGDNICVGFSSSYVLYDIRSSVPKKRELFPISSSRNMDPCISILSENVFGVAKDEFMISVYVPLDQELPTEGQFKPNVQEASTSDRKFGTLQWTEPLHQLVWDEPYLIGVVNETIEVRAFGAVGSTGELFLKQPSL